MPQNRPETEKLWELMATYQPLDAEGLMRAVADHLEFSQSKIRYTRPFHSGSAGGILE